MKRADIKIHFACNNMCDFCAQGSKRSREKRKSLAEITSLLKRARGEGAEGVVFTGGEPTLHPDLPAAAARARGMGYKVIQVQTNGRRFAYLDYCRLLRDSGVNEMSPSLHGSRPEIHEALTHAPGSFRETVQGMMNCRMLGMHLLTNSVITSLNYRDLPALARLLVKVGVDQFQLAFVHIIGTALEKKTDVVPRKSDAMPYIHKAMDIGRAAGVGCFTEAIPFCLMKGYEDCVAERIIPEGPVADIDFYLESYGDYRRTQGKAKREECARCAWFRECEGPWREYPELYGWDEFKPVRKK